MTIDLTGGIDPARELPFAARPDNPDMRDSVSLWVFDERGELGLPRVGIEALASQWDTPAIQVNVAVADGRVYRTREDAPARPVTGSDGRPSVLGAGPLAFECVREFAQWRMTFAGALVETSSSDLVAGRKTGPPVEVAFEVTVMPAVPPWIQGTLDTSSGTQLRQSVEGDLMGGPRYEQLCTAHGTLTVAGDERSFRGSGLRIRRQGVRKLEGFWGHCWQSALFGSGRAFGYIAYPPRPDGQPTFNEGYLFDGAGDLIPARVVEAPWLRRLRPHDEDVSLVLETARGRVRIDGETVLSTHDVTDPSELPPEQREMMANWTFPALQQAGVRYTWDGEQTYGMLERSIPKDRLEA